MSAVEGVSAEVKTCGSAENYPQEISHGLGSSIRMLQNKVAGHAT
jgi:hypothetical protein